MCNEYRMTASRHDVAQATAQLELDFDTTPATGNLRDYHPFPDTDAPVITLAGEDVAPALTLDLMRWGFPPAKDKAPVITNIRNLASPWWKNVNGQYLTRPRYRCLVPFTAFCELHHETKEKHWFTVPQAPVAFFAGIWRPFQGERLMPVEGKTRRQRIDGDYRLFSFLTTDPNAIVAPVHPKAMPVILWRAGDCLAWLDGDDPAALQRPLPDGELAPTAAA